MSGDNVSGLKSGAKFFSGSLEMGLTRPELESHLKANGNKLILPKGQKLELSDGATVTISPPSANVELTQNAGRVQLVASAHLRGALQVQVSYPNKPSLTFRLEGEADLEVQLRYEPPGVSWSEFCSTADIYSGPGLYPGNGGPCGRCD